jgi:hypothetical protein
MNKIKTLLENINNEIEKSEAELIEESRLLAEEEANAPMVSIDNVLEDMDFENAPFTVTEGDDDDVDLEYRNNPAIQSFLAEPLIQHAIDISGFDMYMDENYSNSIFDICEAVYCFANDYGLNFKSHFNAMNFRPSPMLKHGSDLDETSKEFYDALEQAYQMGY